MRKADVHPGNTTVMMALLNNTIFWVSGLYYVGIKLSFSLDKTLIYASSVTLPMKLVTVVGDPQATYTSWSLIKSHYCVSQNFYSSVRLIQ